MKACERDAEAAKANLNDLVVDIIVVRRRQDKMMTEMTTTRTMLEFMERMGEKVDQIEGKVEGIRPRPSRASMEEELMALVVELEDRNKMEARKRAGLEARVVITRSPWTIFG